MKEFAKRFNEMPKYLVTSTIKDPEWNNTTVVDGSGDVPKQVAKLKDDIDGDILVSGSRRLVQELLENGLVDKIRLMVFPVVLGTGNKVFDDFSDKSTWKLNQADQVGSDGVLVLEYEKV